MTDSQTTARAEDTATSNTKSLTPGVELVRLTAGEFIRLHSFKQHEKTLNVSQKGVAFVQFYTEDNVCHNIYTSKSAGEMVEDMDMAKGSPIPKGWLNNFKFMWTRTPSADVIDEATGEVIKEGYSWKIVSPKEGGNRESLEDYLY